VTQYYNFLRLGFEGYVTVQGYSRAVATYLSEHIARLGPFELLTKATSCRSSPSPSRPT